MYDPSNRYRVMSKETRAQAVRDCLKPFLQNTTSEKLCRMKCAKNDMLRCGCLNRKAPYAATCLGPNGQQGDRQKIDLVSYAVMYRLNEREPRLSSMFEEATYYQDQCTGKLK